jgi:DNA-binding IclR family transcriptional regulator
MLAEEKDEDSRQGIQSIEVGVPLLRVLADHGAPMMLRDLAKAAGMPAAKAHRYLVSFVRTGLVTQDSLSGRYDLGHFALDLGLASLARLDAVRVATPVLDALAEEIGETVALAVWGNMGPTIVRWVESRHPVTVNLRTGAVMPLLHSAIGLCFVTFFDSPLLRRRVDEELRINARSEDPRGPRHARATRRAGRRLPQARHVARGGIVDSGHQRLLGAGLRPRRQDGAGDYRPRPRRPRCRRTGTGPCRKRSAPPRSTSRAGWAGAKSPSLGAFLGVSPVPTFARPGCRRTWRSYPPAINTAD